MKVLLVRPPRIKQAVALGELMYSEPIGLEQEDNIMIYDNDFLHNPDRITELCDFLEVERVSKNIICYASVSSILKNQAVIERFQASGLKAVLGSRTGKERPGWLEIRTSVVDRGFVSEDNLKTFRSSTF